MCIASRSRKRLICVHRITLTQALSADSPPLSPDTIAWNATCALADGLNAAPPTAVVTGLPTAVSGQAADGMDADDEEVVLQVENNAAVERSAKISALRKEWGGKGKGGILGDLFSRHEGKGKGGYAFCKNACKCAASALKDGCLKKKGESILNLLDQGILPGEHIVNRPTAAQSFAQAKLHVPLHTGPLPVPSGASSAAVRSIQRERDEMVEPEEDDTLSEDEEEDDADDSEEGISKDKVEEDNAIRFKASAAQNAFWRVSVIGRPLSIVALTPFFFFFLPAFFFFSSCYALTGCRRRAN